MTPTLQRIETSTQWHLHIGTVQIFIVGPGEDAWLACSEAAYTGQVGTDEERTIAHRAILLMDRKHRYDRSLGPREIKRFLKVAARQIADGTPPPAFHRIGARPAIEKPAPLPAPYQPTKEEVMAIVAAAAGFHDVTKDLILSSKRRCTAVSRIRTQTIAAIYQTYPGVYHKHLARILKKDPSCPAASLVKHHTRIRESRSYAKEFIEFTAFLTSPSSMITAH